MSNGEVVVWPGELKDHRFAEGGHTFILGFDDFPICGYTEFDFDRVCICRQRHYGEPHLVITGQARDRYPDLRVLEIICE